MALILFLIFIVVPIAEVAVFIEAGRLIGVLPTIAITIGTAIAGSILMRMQGFATLNRFAQALERGEMPVTPVIDGMGILVAGLLLITPGLLTDAIGFLLFIPPFRRALARWLFNKALKSGGIHIRTFGQRPSGRASSGASPPHGPTFRKADDVIDADFETIDPDDRSKAEPPKPEEDAGHRRNGSPWRLRRE